MRGREKIRAELAREFERLRRRLGASGKSVPGRARDASKQGEGEERFRSLVETASDWIWEVDREGVYTYASPKVRELLGYAPEEVVGKTPFDLMPPREAERVARIFAAIAREKKPFSGLENVNVGKDGRRVVLETSGVPVLDDRGNLLGYRGIDRDITEHKRAEAELIRAGDRFRTLFDVAPVGLGTVDAEGTVLDANAALLDLLAASREEVVGRPMTKWFAPEALEETVASHAEGVRTGKPRESYETRIVNARGETLTIEAKSGLLSREPLVLITSVTDVTGRRRAEEALRESEDRYRALSEASFEGIFMHEGGEVLASNRAFASMLGYDPSEIVGANVLRFARPEYLEGMKARMREGFEGVYEVEMTRRDGSAFAAEVQGRNVTYRNRPVGVVAVRDISERRRREARILRQTALLRGINRVLRAALTAGTDREVARTCVAVAAEIFRSELCLYGELNEKGRFDTLAYSDAGLAAREVSAEEARQRSLGMELYGVWAKPVLEGRSVVMNRAAAFPPGEGAPPGYPQIVSYLGAPIRHRGRVVGLIAVANKEGGYDAADREDLETLSTALGEALYRKRAEVELEGHRRRLEELVEERTSALKEVQERLSAFMEAAPFSFSLWDPELRLVDINASGLRMSFPGRKKEDLLGRKLQEIDRDEHVNGRVDGYLEVMRTGEPFRSVGLASTPEAGERYLAVSAFKVGEGLGLIVEDVTERARAEMALEEYSEELARSNRELEQFAYVASHDMQEPLRMVVSYLQLLEKRYRGALDEDADEFIGYAVDGSIRMQNMINGLLAYSRAGTGNEPFKPVSCDLLLGKVVDDLKLAVEESEGEVAWDPLPEVWADEAQLLQVFRNLVSNSVKFRGDEPPRIHVSAERRGADWVFAVRDNGMGIDPAFHERIFQIFERLHTTARYPGTGIGLALARKIVERHGGRIWLESEPGEGATFYFTLPAERR